MKQKITNRLSRLFLLLFLFVTGYITWFTFTGLTQAPVLAQFLSAPGQVLCVGAGALLLFLFFLALQPLLRRLSARQEQILFMGVLVLIFLGQLFFITSLHQSTFMYDPYRVFDEALHMQTTHTVSGTVMEGYYAIYPNNIPFTLLCYWILRLGSGLGLTDAGLMLLLQVLNALCMDAALILTAILLRRHVSVLSMRLFLVISMLNPLVYLWPGFVYTSTVSMPFIMGALLLFLEICRETSPRRKGILATGLGIVLVLGFEIRATVIITLIAAILYFFLGVMPALPAAARRTACFTGCILFLSIGISFTAWKGIQKQYVSFDTTDTAFPVVSWLAMGLEGDGMFNTQDYYDTKNAATAAEKKAVNEEKLRTRLSSLGVRGWFDLAGRKLVRTWADGTDDYPSYLNQYSHTGKLHTWLLEDKKDFLVLFMQCMRCFLFLFTVIGAAFLLFRPGNAPSGPLLLLQLNLLGGSFFHVLWETGELYSLCFSFLLFALAAAGLEEACQCLSQSSARDTAQSKPSSGAEKSLLHSLRGFPVLCALLLLTGTAFGLYRHTGDFTRVPVKKHTTLISQKTYTDAFPDGLTTGNTLTQTFLAAQPFNRVAVRVKNVVADHRDSQYQITVTDDAGFCYMDKTVTGQDVFDYDYFYLGLDTEAAPEASTRYTITITCIQGTSDNSIAFLSYDTGNHDAYPFGTLYVNGQEQAQADLNFQVYRSYEDVWMRPTVWYGLCALLLAAEAGILLCLWRQTI